MDQRVIDKFWNNIEKMPDMPWCWNWTGGFDREDPIFCFGTRRFETYERYLARRVSLILAGRELVETKHILPGICRNRSCVNPDHLVIGDEARFWSKVCKLDSTVAREWKHAHATVDPIRCSSSYD